MSKNVLTDKLSEPFNGETTARIDIHAGDGNLMIDGLSGQASVLASGTLQYFEKQGRPTRNLVSSNDQATLTLRGGRAGQPWFRMPWAACNGATEWQIHLNRTISSDITAHSDGGNIRLNLANMTVTQVCADTGGGNIDVILPGQAANLNVTARTGGGSVSIEIATGIRGSNIISAGSGAGNVVVRIPGGIAARIHATTGLGKVLVDPRFSKTDPYTYQSPDFDHAVDKIEITAKSGAGNVSVVAA